MKQLIGRGSILVAFFYMTTVIRAEGIDLVTLPERAAAQLTIYNSADLTLVRDLRKLTLRKGRNRLSFEWTNTLIDPTSLHLHAVKTPRRSRFSMSPTHPT